MKTKSTLSGLAASALFLLLSCGSHKSRPNNSNTAVQRCVDKDNRVVDDQFCEEQARKGNSYPAPYGFHWLYGGPPGYVPIGRAVYGGTTTRPATPFFVRPTSSASDPTIVERSGTPVGTRSSFAASGSEDGTVRGVLR